MTNWEIGKAIQEAGKAIAAFPMTIIERADDDVITKFNALRRSVESYQEFSRRKIKELEALDAEHAKKIEKLCKHVKQRNQIVADLMDEIDTKKLHHVSTLCDAINKLRSIDPADLDLLISAINKKETP